MSFYEYFIKRIFDIKVNLPKIITLENSGMATIDPLSFVLHQIDSKLLNHSLTLIIKFFNSIMTGVQAMNKVMMMNQIYNKFLLKKLVNIG